MNPAFESVWPDDDYQYSKFTYNKKVLKAQGINYAIVITVGSKFDRKEKGKEPRN